LLRGEVRICDVFIYGVQTKRKPSDHILGKRECSEYLIKFVLESKRPNVANMLKRLFC